MIIEKYFFNIWQSSLLAYEIYLLLVCMFKIYCKAIQKPLQIRRGEEAVFTNPINVRQKENILPEFCNLAMNKILQNPNKTEIQKIKILKKDNLAIVSRSLDFCIWGRHLWLFEQTCIAVVGLDILANHWNFRAVFVSYKLPC